MTDEEYAEVPLGTILKFVRSQNPDVPNGTRAKIIRVDAPYQRYKVEWIDRVNFLGNKLFWRGIGLEGSGMEVEIVGYMVRPEVVLIEESMGGKLVTKMIAAKEFDPQKHRKAKLI